MKLVMNFQKTLESLKKLYDPFLWMGFNCVKAAEPLRGDSLLCRARTKGLEKIEIDLLKEVLEII